MTESSPETRRVAERLMSEPILSQDFADRMTDDVCDAFDFDTLFDLMWDMDGNDMRRCGLTEESIFYFRVLKTKKVRRFTKITRRSTCNMP